MGMSTAALAVIMAAGLLNGTPKPGTVTPETQVELRYLLVDAGISPNVDVYSTAGIRLAQAEFTSLTGFAATVNALRAYDATRPPSAAFRDIAERWLASWYPHRSSTLALHALQSRLAISRGPLNGSRAVTLIHLFGVHEAYLHHWTYRAQPGDSLTELAVASGQPLSKLIQDNPLHAPSLWVGQNVHWNAPKPTAKTIPAPPPAKSTQEPSTPLTTTGVLADLRPIAGLAIINPSVTALRALLAVEPLGQSVTLAVTGQWALLHSRLIVSSSNRGNTVAIEGYSTTNLAALPPSGVRQELAWGQAIISGALKHLPVYMAVLPSDDIPTIVNIAKQLKVRPVVAQATLDPKFAWATTVSRLLLSHPNQLAVVAPPPSKHAWQELFRRVHKEHLTLETLAQIWSSS